MAVSTFARRFRPGRAQALVGSAVVGAEVLAVVGYLLFADVRVTDPLILVYPLVWINVGLWAVWRTRPPAAGRRRRLAVGAVALAYLGVLAAVGGVIGWGHLAHGHDHAPSIRVAYATLPPGFGPAVLAAAGGFSLTLLPYQVVGYAALAYLVYARVLEATGTAISGLLGLLSCVSCAWPVLGTALAAVFGSGSAVYAFALSQSYGLSTLVFLSAVALLRWRPEF